MTLKPSLFLLVLAGTTLCAQDHAVSLLYTQSQPDKFTVGSHSYDTTSYKGLGLRYGQTVFKALDARFEFQGTWKLRTSGSPLHVDGGSVPNYTLRQESLGLGLSATWTRVVDFGATLDIRHDNTSLYLQSGGATASLDQIVVRPWLGVHIGYTFVMAPVQPFVSLEYGMPLAKKEAPLDESTISAQLRPKSELSFVVGLRF